MTAKAGPGPDNPGLEPEAGAASANHDRGGERLSAGPDNEAAMPGSGRDSRVGNMGSGPAIVVEHLTKRFAGMDRPALDDVSAGVARGGITGLVGPDGAGKTTFIRLLVGLLHADSGSVMVEGYDARTRAEKIHPLIGYMPQKFGLYEDLSVMENLRLYADLRGVSGPARREKFERLLAFTALAPFTERLAGKLSGGMKQKLGLACALLGEPKVLLLDEPSVGVDPISRRELWQMVQRLLSEGMAVLWSTSYLDEAEKCDAVILLNEGTVLFDGKPAEILQRVKGRSWKLEDIAAEKRRDLLMRLLSQPWVTDAVIQGRALRVVSKGPGQKRDETATARLPDRDAPQAGPPGKDAPRAGQQGQDGPQAGQQGHDRAAAADGLCPDMGDCPPLEGLGEGRWAPAPPRFEDAFIDILGGGPDGKSTLGEKIDPKPDTGRPVIDAEKLSKRFGDFTAVKDNTFRISRGEIFGLLGPNGAGKSTTFKMMCGLLKPSSGRASIMDIDLEKSSSRARARIGYMAQKFSLYGALSVLQNLKFFSGVYGLAGKERDEAVDMMVSLFKLSGCLGMSAETLPLGFKQRLALACAVMHQPDVLFLDEPTSGVDPVTRREFWMHINAMVRKGVTVMVTTHFMDEAEYCDRIALIYHGENIATGTPDELKDRVRSKDLPDPSLEDAFIALITASDAAKATEGGP